ncbi:MAG TPA: T9SS type A sorting domain-containing protein, partial [Bacteroidia bacterium]|nr:T9SS type A sorting domain-containing protein [Bacteroidia bacterium]
VYVHGFPDNTILGILIDSGGVKWMTCPAGALVAFFNGTWIAYNTTSSAIPTNSFSSLAQDSLQNIYMGSYDKGLVKKQGFYYYHWNTTNSNMPDDVVFTVAIERTGIIWAGTESHGVVRFDENQWVGLPPMLEYNPVSLYPNPCRQFVNLVPNGVAVNAVRVRNMSGEIKLLQKFITPVSTFTSLDISSLPAGVYFVSIDTGEKSITKKVVKVE